MEQQTTSRGRWIGVAEVLGVATIAFALRWTYRNSSLHPDEYYHLLAARSRITDGSLKLTPEAALPYDRARGFTEAVALAYRAFGESVDAARVPSIVCGVLLVVAVFVALRRMAGRPAAYAAAALLGASLPAIHMSAMARFYMPHALGVWLALWATAQVARLLGEPGRQRPRFRSLATWCGVGAFGWLLAWHMQITSAIPMAISFVWIAMAAAWGVWRGVLPRPGRRVAVALGVALVAGVLALWLVGVFDYLLERYRRPRIWSEPTRGDWAYYHREMAAWRPLLYAAFPLAAAAAWRVAPVLGSLLATVAVGSFAAHSFLEPKADRYLFYALPCFYAVVGMGVGGAAGWIVRCPRTQAQRGVVAAALLLALAYAAWRTPEYHRVQRILRGDEAASPYREADWAAARRGLQRELAEADVVVTSGSPRGLYELGRNDVTISVTQLEGQPEWTIEPRTGRPTISTPGSVRELIARHPRGLIVATHGHWRDPTKIAHDVADEIERHAVRVSPDPGYKMLAYRWGEWEISPEPIQPERRATAAPAPPAGEGDR